MENLIDKKCVELIRQVHSFFQDREKFNGTWFAKNKEGQSVAWNSAEAVSFDLLGAFHKFGQDDAVREEALHELKLMLPAGYERLYMFSERAGYEQMMALLTKAIDPAAQVQLHPAPASFGNTGRVWAPMRVPAVATTPVDTLSTIRDQLEDPAFIETTAKLMADLQEVHSAKEIVSGNVPVVPTRSFLPVPVPVLRKRGRPPGSKNKPKR